MYFKIIDNDTLEYGDKEYLRIIGEINGIYATDDGSIKFENGNFERNAYESEAQTGTYSVEDYLIRLNYSKENNEKEKWMIFDNDIIILERETTNGRIVYSAYIKH